MTNKLKDKFEHFGDIPNPEVWEGIERTLDQQKKPIFSRKQKIGASLALFLLLFTSLFMLIFDTPSSTSKNASSNKSISQSTAKLDTTKVSTPISQSSQATQNKNHKNLVRKTDTNFLRKIAKHQSLSNSTDETCLEDSLNVSENTPIKDSIKEKNIRSENEIKDTNLATIHTSPLVLPTEEEKAEPLFSHHVELKVGALNAFNNYNQVVPQLNSFPTSLNAYEHYTVFRPITAKLNYYITTPTNYRYSAGLNYDWLQLNLKQNQQTVNVNAMSLGLNLGGGYVYANYTKWKIVPYVSGNIDMRFNKTEVLVPTGSNTLSPTSTSKQFQSSVDVSCIFERQLSPTHSITVTPLCRFYLFQQFDYPVSYFKRNFWYGLQLGYQWEL